MKAFLITLFIFSTSISADDNASLLRKAESASELVDHSESLQSLISEINNGTFDPMFYVDDSQLGKEIYTSSSEHSPLFNRTVKYRMSYEKLDDYVGSQEENLNFLKLLIKKGFNVNAVQPTNVHGISSDYLKFPIYIASRACNISVINLLLQNGADPSADQTSWSSALYTSYKQKEDSRRLDCQIVAEYMLSKAKSVAAIDVYKLFGSGDTSSKKASSWIGGDVVQENFTPQMIETFNKRFGVKFSTKPSGDEPSDEWFEQFRDHLERPFRNGDLPAHKQEDFARVWFNSQSSSLKAWACYYSTFDEGYDLLLKDGQTDDWLMTCPPPGQPGGQSRCYGSWAPKEFRAYCKSIK